MSPMAIWLSLLANCFHSEQSVIARLVSGPLLQYSFLVFCFPGRGARSCLDADLISLSSGRAQGFILKECDDLDEYFSHGLVSASR